MRGVLLAAGVVGLSCLVVFSGCKSSEETAERDQLTKNVGIYPPPPPELVKAARAGVAGFEVTGEGSTVQMTKNAAAQLTSLVQQTKRFRVIERDELGQLLKEQNLEGIVRPEEMARAGQVRGVDFLFYGKITNFRVKAEKTSTGFGFGDIPIIGTGHSVGGFDYKNKQTKITVECGVDVKMVDPTEGEIAAAHFGEFKRSDTLEAIGVEVLGASAEADADLKFSENDQGKILRLALDEAVRKMLDDIDESLAAKVKAAKTAPAVAPAPAPAAPAAPVPATPAVAPAPETPAAPAATAAKKFCPECGTKIEAAGAKFCPGCGKPI